MPEGITYITNPMGWRISEVRQRLFPTRCEALTHKATRCRSLATWRVLADGSAHACCERHKENHRRGWWDV